jgi:RNA polymerase sigma factor (sigma-70 family)
MGAAGPPPAGILLATRGSVNVTVEAPASPVPPPADSAGLASYLQRVRLLPALGGAEERGLVARVQRLGDQTAARRLVTGHLASVVRIARQYEHLHPNLLELIQEGNLALVRAVRRYDPHRSGSFSTYVGAWIRTCVGRFVLSRQRSRLQRPTRPAAIDQRASGLSHDDDPLLPFEQNAFLARLSTLLPRFTETLPARERRILSDRVLSDSPRTLSQQARELGITAERVRQIELSLIGRLRQELLSSRASWASARNC